MQTKWEQDSCWVIIYRTKLKLKSTPFLKTTQPRQISRSKSSETHYKKASWILKWNTIQLTKKTKLVSWKKKRTLSLEKVNITNFSHAFFAIIASLFIFFGKGCETTSTRIPLISRIRSFFFKHPTDFPMEGTGKAFDLSSSLVIDNFCISLVHEL